MFLVGSGICSGNELWTVTAEARGHSVQLWSILGCAVYYLGIIKQVFFDKPEYKLNPALENVSLHGNVFVLEKKKETWSKTQVIFKHKNIVLSNSLTVTISTLSLLLLLFVFTPQEILSKANILALTIFNC